MNPEVVDEVPLSLYPTVLWADVATPNVMDCEAPSTIQLVRVEL